MEVFVYAECLGTSEVHLIGTIHIVWINRNLCPRTDEDWHLIERDTDSLEPETITSIDSFACEEIDPLSSWQVDITNVLAIHDRTTEELGAEVILIVNMPDGRIIGVREQQSPEHRIARSGCSLSLCVDIRHESVTELPPALDDGCNGRIMPRLALVATMIAHVRREDPKLRPTNVNIVMQGRVHEIWKAVEAWHIMAPEREA